MNLYSTESYGISTALCVLSGNAEISSSSTVVGSDRCCAPGHGDCSEFQTVGPATEKAGRPRVGLRSHIFWYHCFCRLIELDENLYEKAMLEVVVGFQRRFMDCVSGSLQLTKPRSHDGKAACQARDRPDFLLSAFQLGLAFYQVRFQQNSSGFFATMYRIHNFFVSAWPSNQRQRNVGAKYDALLSSNTVILSSKNCHL